MPSLPFVTILTILSSVYATTTTTDVGTYWTTQLNIAVTSTATTPSPFVACYFALLLSSLWNAYTDPNILNENDRIIAANYAAYTTLQSLFPSRQNNNIQALKG